MLFRGGAAPREKAARLLFALAIPAHGRAALCHEEGANLPDALVAAMEAEGASLRGETTSTTSTTEAMEAMETGDGAPFEGSKKKPREVAAARRCRVAATCARNASTVFNDGMRVSLNGALMPREFARRYAAEYRDRFPGDRVIVGACDRTRFAHAI